MVMLACCFLKASITASSKDFWKVEPEPASVAVICSAVVVVCFGVVLFDALFFLSEPHALAVSPTSSSRTTSLPSRERIIDGLPLSCTAGRSGTSMNLRDTACPRTDTMMNDE